MYQKPWKLNVAPDKCLRVQHINVAHRGRSRQEARRRAVVHTCCHCCTKDSEPRWTFMTSRHQIYDQVLERSQRGGNSKGGVVLSSKTLNATFSLKKSSAHQTKVIDPAVFETRENQPYFVSHSNMLQPKSAKMTFWYQFPLNGRKMPNANPGSADEIV